MSIATRTGDDGSTGLFGGSRVQKDHPRVAAYGDVDELNSTLGLARCESLLPECERALARVQSDLFALGAELATPRDGNPSATKVAPFADVPLAALDRDLAIIEAALAPLTAFILPGGTRAAALLQVARSVCRRAERAVVALAHHEAVPSSVLRYLNRLSDVLFLMARLQNLRAGVTEPTWRP